jgi:hypothetical protein
VPDFIALRGDPSDKLPGATGVGPIRAAQLVRRYGSLSGVLDAGLFQNQAEMLRLYRLITTMDASAPLPSLADQTPTWDSASSLARSWGLNQLADRVPRWFDLAVGNVAKWLAVIPCVLIEPTVFWFVRLPTASGAKQAHLSATAAAADLNARNITTLVGGRWHAMQVIRARQRLEV